MTTSDRFSAPLQDEPKCNKGTPAVLVSGSGDRGREPSPAGVKVPLKGDAVDTPGNREGKALARMLSNPVWGTVLIPGEEPDGVAVSDSKANPPPLPDDSGGEQP